MQAEIPGMKYIFYAFLAYLAYQLIFNLVIPLFRTTRKIKKGFREMAEKMNEAERSQQQEQQATTQQNKIKKAAEEDYIDFEEIK